MTKFLLHATFLLFLINSVYSQTDYHVYSSVGFTYSDLEWIYEEEMTHTLPDGSIITVPYTQWGNNPSFGFYSGVEFEFFKRDYFSFTSGIAFYQKGATDYTSYRFVTWYLDYLTIDANMKVQHNFGIITPYLLIGPRIDYLLKYSSEFHELQNEAGINRINYGFRYGIGLQKEFQVLIFGVSWQNNINLNSIVNNLEGASISTPFQIWDQTMIIKLNIGIKLNRKAKS